MDWSAPAVFAALEAHLPPALVGAEQRRRCAQVATRLPRGAVSYYLECRLDRREQVDFLVLFKNRRAVATHFAASEHAEDPVWRRNLALLRGWNDVGSPISEVALLWLEYDIDASFDALRPRASPSLCLEDDYYARYIEARTVDPARGLGRAAAALPLLIDASRRVPVDAQLRRCVATLPREGSLIYLSEMTARTPSVTKLYIAVPRDGVLDYLRAIDWPGHPERVAAVLTEFYRDGLETVFLDISIGERVLARLGMALSQLHRRESTDFHDDWRKLPFRTQECAKIEALRSWPGYEERWIDGWRTWLARWIDIKVVLDENGELATKAYLGFMPQLPPPFA